MNRKLDRCLLQLLVAGLIASFARVAAADAYINELYFNPPNHPSVLDSTAEYVELRGTPSMSLANHYLIFVDTRDNSFHTDRAGLIEHIFNLNGRSFGTNGFLTIRQKGDLYGTIPTGSTNLVNSGSGSGFGSGSTSNIGASDFNNNGEIASGFTAMLIRTDGLASFAPAINQDLDNGNNGLDTTANDSNAWRDHWTILDSIGFTEPSEAFTARYYGTVNFGPELPDLDPQSITYFDPAAHLEPGATYAGTGFEIEYIARWGNSTGQTAADWHVSNLTDDAGSGYQTLSPPAYSPNFRQGGNPNPVDDGNINTPPPQPSTIESTKGVPYGTIITNTLGAPNFLLGDYNKDGFVTAADYVIWRKTVGQHGTDLADNPADGDHDYVVGPGDYTAWRAHFGQPFVSGSAGAGSSLDTTSGTVPEPAGWCLAVFALLSASQLRKRPAR